MLETAPSLSIYTDNTTNDEEDDKRENESEEGTFNLIKSVKISEKTLVGSGNFTFVKPDNMDLIKEEEEEEEGGGNNIVVVLQKKMSTEEEEQQQEVDPPSSPPMYLATGIGINEVPDNFREDKEYGEEFYRELLQDFPNHPLVLKNFAQLLQRKGDLQGAEEYYFRATKADPGDGEILSQYAMLMWELHHDKESASTYLELAVHTAPKDCNVLAAYAKFLWEIDSDGDDGQEDLQRPIHLHHTAGNEVGIDGFAGGNDVPIAESVGPEYSVDLENYYMKMTEENPSDPHFLKKYAQFLYLSKGDLQGAEDYYSRVVLASPQDGETLSQYATLLWELYHDQERTLSYMEQAVEAARGDSNVLAAYARFLWTIDDDGF